MSPFQIKPSKPKLKKKKKTRKEYTTRQNQDKVRLSKQFSKEPLGQKTKLAKDLGFTRQNFYNWNAHEGLKECWKSRKANRGRYFMSATDPRLIGKFWEQQRKVYNLYRYRRSQGDPCDGAWFRIEMKRICDKDKPVGYDPKKNKFSDMWKSKFCKRWKISVQKKTNQKNKSVFERIHQVKNYHFYTIYNMRREPI